MIDFLSDKEAIGSKKTALIAPGPQYDQFPSGGDFHGYYPGTKYYLQPMPILRGAWVNSMESTPDPQTYGLGPVTLNYFNKVALLTLVNGNGRILLDKFPLYEITNWSATPIYPDSSGDYNYPRKFALYDVSAQLSFIQVTEFIELVDQGPGFPRPAYDYNLIFHFSKEVPYQ